jgi:hypothetical protein
MTIFTIDCTGDVVAGDTVRFTEAVFGGPFRRPRFLGERTITALVVAETYGQDRGQHTFTLTVVAAEGTDPPAPGSTIRRKGRNLYRRGVTRAAWADEDARRVAASEKHERGDRARARRAAQLEEGWR